MKTSFVTPLFFLSLVCIYHESNAQSIPTDGLSPYGKYRQEILQLGWKSKPSINPDYVPEWPELICGNRLCSATFISPNGKELLSLSIWPVVKPGHTDYYVAPAFDIIDCSDPENTFVCQ